MTPTRTVGRYGRTYVWPEKKPHELTVPSVTTIIGGGIPKPALAPWNAKMVAAYAVDNRESWAGLERDAAIDLLKRSPFRKTKKAADHGKLVHTALEAFSNGEDELPTLPEKSHRKQYEGALQFLRDFKVEPLFTEFTVFSREHEYAGTSDLLGPVTFPPEMLLDSKERPVCIVDYKTGKAIYPEAAIQLNSYARGDFIADGATGTELPLPLIDYLIVVRPKRRGGYEVKVYEPSQAVFDLFLAAKRIHERDEILAHVEVGRVLTGPEEGDE
jgi:hypothetical protein